MTGQEILTRFHLYVGDQSELSTEDELALANKKYDEVLGNRPWEFLKTSASGSILSDGTVSYITLPYDFRYFIENNQKTDNSESPQNNASPKVVFVGPNYIPYQIINFSDRRQFRNSSGYAYPDLANQRLVFTMPPADTTYEFDYVAQWTPLELGTSPIFPVDFHPMIAQLMAVDSTIIELFDRAHSYAKENQAEANESMARLCHYNSLQTFN